MSGMATPYLTSVQRTILVSFLEDRPERVWGRKRAAESVERLCKRGLLIEIGGDNGMAYAVTEAGKAAIEHGR